MAGSNWYVSNSQPGPTPLGGTAVGGGGSGGVSYRSDLDARRSMAGQESQYPDGYLGTITDRQQDKVLAKVQSRLSDRSYQRGVHVGSKIGQSQYFWDADMNPDMGLQRQAASVPVGNVLVSPRFAPTGLPEERLAHMGKNDISTPEAMGLARQYGVDSSPLPSPGRRERMRSMLPRTSF